jgi:hypothetical protein
MQVAGFPAFDTADVKVPYTLHPTPSTLHPKPSTINPQPSSLNLKVVAGSGVTQTSGKVVSLTQKPGASLSSSKGELVHPQLSTRIPNPLHRKPKLETRTKKL